MQERVDTWTCYTRYNTPKITCQTLQIFLLVEPSSALPAYSTLSLSHFSSTFAFPPSLDTLENYSSFPTETETEYSTVEAQSSIAFCLYIAA